MKTLSLFFLVSVLNISLFAQSNYERAMEKAISKFSSAAGIEEFQASISQFERIAEVEVNEWLPVYYSSLIYCFIAFEIKEPEKKQQFINLSQSNLDKAMEIESEHSEIHTLQGMIYQATIDIDPVRNGAQYSSKANGCFQTAMKLNPENPRSYFLQAITIRRTPKQFGGGNKNALPLFEKALELFNNYVPESNIFPNWGKDDCIQHIKECKEEQEGV